MLCQQRNVDKYPNDAQFARMSMLVQGYTNNALHSEEINTEQILDITNPKNRRVEALSKQPKLCC